ncbi:MAG: NADH-quinone oxidoreductase subunit I [Aquificaceae bacterium]|nr:NADH-quinone oxidoreductase subunit I [Aquificaceae bacterium]MDW8237230.1 NADH-quinone oxidoreductase subunit I [Aquificaceae bacterium]
MIKKVLRKPFLNIFETVFFIDFIIGLSTTLKNLLRKPFTTNYPIEKLKPPIRYRGAHGHFVWDGTEPPSLKAIEKFMSFERGKSRCVACYMCQTACPMPTLFRIEAIQMPDGTKKVVRFDMNLLNCLFCGLCVDACPVGCLTMTDLYELAGYSRRSGVLNTSNLEQNAIDWKQRRGKEKDRIWADDEMRERLWGKIKWSG